MTCATIPVSVKDCLATDASVTVLTSLPASTDVHVYHNGLIAGCVVTVGTCT